MPVITIRGQLGSGAPDIGRIVADLLHISYVDREVIAEVAARLKYPEKHIEEKEMPAATLRGRITEALKHSYPPVGIGEGLNRPMYLPSWEVPLDDPSYKMGLESVIRELAASQAIVIRGRGSQFILKDFPGALHVLTIAPLGVRVARIMKIMELDEKAARQEITRFDSSRHEFIKRYFKAELEDTANYDIVINTGRWDFREAASIVLGVLSIREKS